MLPNILNSIKQILFIIAGCFLILCHFTCQAQNLISNPTFEINGQPSGQFWYDMCGTELTSLCDTIFPDTVCGTHCYQDAPPGGGSWCLDVTGEGNNPPGYAETYITGQSGTHIYELSAWMKDSGNASGGVSINIKSQGPLFVGKSVPADSVGWALYILTDTLTLQPSDTIVVSLDAAAVGPLGGSILFDLIELKKNDTVSGITITNIQNVVKIHPNPTPGQFTITLPGAAEGGQLFIYDLLGQAVLRQNLHNNLQTLNLAAQPAGIYFVKVVTSEGIFTAKLALAR